MIDNKKLYRRWRAMVSRCHDDKAKDYKYYGRKGVRVCREWFDYRAFKSWFCERTKHLPSVSGMDVDRIDPRKGYSPNNCRVIPHRINVLRAIKRDGLGRFSRKGRKHVYVR